MTKVKNFVFAQFLFFFFMPVLALGDSTLVGYWKFEEGSGTTAYDSSGYGNNGTLMNGPVWVSGRCGQALSLDGTNDYVQVNDSPSLDITGSQFTLCAWVYPKEQLSFSFQDIVAKRSYDLTQYALSLDPNYPPTSVKFGVSLYNGNNVYSYGNTFHPVNNWYFITGVYNGSRLRLYVNNQLEVDIAASGNLQHLAVPVQIGQFNWGPSFFNGLIDEVKIYNRALSANEIKQEYERCASTLVGYWKFDEGTDTIAYDSSGYGNDGTLRNGPTWVDGPCGKALNFDGVNDYVDVPDAPSLDITGQITLEAWIYPKSYCLGLHCGFISKNLYSDQTYKFMIVDNAALYFELNTDSGYIGVATNPTTQPLSSLIPLNTWSHVAAVYDGTYMLIYVNGTEVARHNVGLKTIMTNTRSLKIGSDAFDGLGGRIFDGGIDEVKIYNRALSANEIKQEYQTCAPPPQPIRQDTLTVTAHSPVNLVVTDPAIDSIGLDTNGIRPDTIFNTILQESFYDTSQDVNSDGDKDIIVVIPKPYQGPYQIRVVPKTTGEFSLDYQIGNNSQVRIADSVIITTTDTNFTYGLEVLPTLRGDANRDRSRNLIDIVYLVNYVFHAGPPPDPVDLGNVNCAGGVNLTDIIYMVNYVFKAGPAPCS